MAHSFRETSVHHGHEGMVGQLGLWRQEQEEAEAVHVAVSPETRLHFKLGMEYNRQKPAPSHLLL